MQIVSASRRTDLPAFYAPWLLNRIRVGTVRVANPFNPTQVRSVSLSPEDVACLVLWTRDPRPLLPHLDELEGRGIRTLFQVTLTGLPRRLEPGVPGQEETVPAIRALSRRLGPRRVVWRFDPLLPGPLAAPRETLDAFTTLARGLEGTVERVVISLGRPYRQVRTRLRRAGLAEPVDWSAAEPDQARRDLAPLLEPLAATARRHDLRLQACAEPLDLEPFGIPSGSCIDAAHIGEIFGLPLRPRRDPGQRAACRCSPSVDIGSYGTCRHGCLYCYAAGDRELARGARHDPAGARLLVPPAAAANLTPEPHP